MSLMTPDTRPGTDIGPWRDRLPVDRSLATGTGRDRFSSSDSSHAYARSDLQWIGPYPSLPGGQGPIGTDFRGYDALYAHTRTKEPNPAGTDIGPSGPCRTMWITR